VLATPLLLCTYIVFDYINEDLVEQTQYQISDLGSAYAVSVCAIILAVMTYYEDMIILF